MLYEQKPWEFDKESCNIPAQKELRESVCEVHDGPSGEQDGVARQEGLLAAEAVRQETAGHETAHAEELHDAHCGTNRGGYYKSA